MDRVKAELTGGAVTGYVVLRVDEGENFSQNRGNDLRMLIAERPPTAAEQEALEEGLKALGARNALLGGTAEPARFVAAARGCGSFLDRGGSGVLAVVIGAPGGQVGREHLPFGAVLRLAPSGADVRLAARPVEFPQLGPQ
jgi:hypothetical protein